MTKKNSRCNRGGAAGHRAYDLKDVISVTLIDPETYCEVPIARLRLLVDTDALPARMTFESFLPGVRHIQGRAIGIAGRSVEVETATGSERVTFDDALSLAT